MKKRKTTAVCLALCLLLNLPACAHPQQAAHPDESPKTAPSSQTQTESQPPPAPDIPDLSDTDLSGELTIRDCIAPSESLPTQLESFAAEFMALHPDVTINVEYYTESASGRAQVNEAYEAFSTEVRMEMVSGEADYLLFFPSSRMNLYELSESGVLMDMRPYFDNDPTVDPQDYFTQVFDAVSVNGKLTTVPISFSLEGLYLNRNLMEALKVDLDGIKEVDWQALLDWHQQGLALQKDLDVLAGGEMHEQLFALEKPAYIDWETRTASFQSPGFIDYLTRTGAITEKNAELNEISRAISTEVGIADLAMQSWAAGKNLFDPADTARSDIVDKGVPSVAVLSGIGLPDLAYASEPLNGLAGPYPAVTSDGKLGVFSKEDFAVPSSIKDPRLAWKFIAFCMQEREELLFEPGFYFTGYIPVNRKNLVALLEDGKGKKELFYTVLQAGYAMESYDAAAGAEKLEECLSLPLINGKNYGVNVDEYLEEYYTHNLTTPEQCAKKLQDRAYIWLNE